MIQILEFQRGFINSIRFFGKNYIFGFNEGCNFLNLRPRPVPHKKYLWIF